MTNIPYETKQNKMVASMNISFGPILKHLKYIKIKK